MKCHKCGYDNAEIMRASMKVERKQKELEKALIEVRGHIKVAHFPPVSPTQEATKDRLWRIVVEALHGRIT